MSVQRVKEIYRNKEEDFVFPLKPLYDVQNRQLAIPDKTKLDAVAVADRAAAEWECLPGDSVAQPGQGESSSSGHRDAPIQSLLGSVPEEEVHDAKPLELSKELPDEAANHPKGPASRGEVADAQRDVKLLPNGDTVVFDRVTRKYKGSLRPPHLWPEAWQALSKKRKEEIKKYQDYLRDQPNTTNEQELACAAEDDSGWQFTAAVAADGPPPLVSEDVSVPCPAMPVKPHKNDKHRILIPEHAYPFSALVARPVGKTEIRAHPEAQKALDKEWNKLVAKKTWDESQFYEWADVARDAQRRKVKAHVGRVFEICVEKE